ncbi:MAG: hypothetical protein ABSA58_00240 [Acetobacteraceae bacterium]|jgi:hypothetical protein
MTIGLLGAGDVPHAIHQIAIKWAMAPGGGLGTVSSRFPVVVVVRTSDYLARAQVGWRHVALVSNPASFKSLPSVNDAIIVHPPFDSIELMASVLHTLEQFVEVLRGLNVIFDAGPMKDIFHLVAEAPSE